MQWHEAMPQRWAQEQSIAAALLQDFEAGIGSDDFAFVRGLFNVVSEHGHVYETVKLRVVYPSAFPVRNQPPSVYLESHRDRWIKGGNSHIEDDWRLCLFVPSESGITFGEMTSDEKHGLPPRGQGLSHRARAFMQLAQACLKKPV